MNKRIAIVLIFIVLASSYAAITKTALAFYGLTVYAYDNYGRQITADVYIDSQYYGTTNTGQGWFLTYGYHTIQVSVPGGNSFQRFISNNAQATDPVYYYSNPDSVLVNSMRTLTAYYITSNPPQPQGYDYGYGRASVLYSTDWIMQSQDLSDVNTAFSSMYSQFNAHSGTYGHLKNYKSQTTWDNIRTQIQDIEAYHGSSTIFYYGHMGLRNVGNPWPDYSYGIHVQANPADQSPQDTIWDTDVKQYTTGDNHFVFLWVCNNGNTAGSSTPYAHGAPYCWTNQILATHYTDYPYTDSAHQTYCFIGFENASVTLMEGMGTYNSTENSYRYWLTFFYYAALSRGDTVNQALDWASHAVNYAGGWTDQANRLYNGYNYIWWGGGGIPYQQIWGRMRIYGDGGTRLR